MEQEPNEQFYKHFYNETLFVVPGEARPQQSAETPQPAAAKHAAVQPVPAAFTVSGKNSKGLVVLVSLPEPQFVAFRQSEFLWKVLGAVQFGPEDAGLVNVAPGQEVSLEEISAALPTRFLISFSKNALKTPEGVLAELYKPLLIHQVPVIPAEPLAAIEADQAKKKLLWAALQQVFKK